jgi:two-component system phosphate regulon sensor histidine kinase PhoR
LIDLIRDLLDLSRLESASPPKPDEIEEVNLIDELDLILGVEKTGDHARGITISFNHPSSLPALRYSRAAIQQIFSNLISNALRYTPEGGTVEIDLNQEDHRIKCRVSDTGIGIPEDSQSQIFSEFYRAPNAKQVSRAGTGLGLSITKALINRYGGEIHLQSEEGRGTTFTIYFYMNPRRAPQRS